MGQYQKDKSLPDPASSTNAEFKCVLQTVRDSIMRGGADATKWTRMLAKCKGVSEETTTGVMRLKEMAAKGELAWPAINVNDCVTKSKFDIFVSTTGNFNIIRLEHMKKMKNNAIVGNIGHFDNEIDMAGIENFPGIKVDNIKPQVDRF